jgi:hypothetical protein
MKIAVYNPSGGRSAVNLAQSVYASFPVVTDEGSRVEVLRPGCTEVTYNVPEGIPNVRVFDATVFGSHAITAADDAIYCIQAFHDANLLTEFCTKERRAAVNKAKQARLDILHAEAALEGLDD